MEALSANGVLFYVGFRMGFSVTIIISITVVFERSVHFSMHDTFAGTACREGHMCCTFHSNDGYYQRIKEKWSEGCPHMSSKPTASLSFGRAPFRTALGELFLCCIARLFLILSARLTSQRILSIIAIALG